MQSSVRNLLFIVLLACTKSGFLSNIQAEDLVPAYLIEIPDSIESVLIADTENATLIHYSVAKRKLIKSDESYMSIGLKGSGKQKQGDKKTPIGTYFITKKLDASKLPLKYGAAAYPLDYPNAWDRYNDKTGYGIWLHGTNPNIFKRPPFDTDGCLALPNKEIIQLSSTLALMVTPVIITKKIHWKSLAEITLIRDEIHGVLDAWKRSFEESKLERFLSFYEPNPSVIPMTEHSIINNLSIINKSMIIEDLMIIGEPSREDVVLSRFTQKIKYNDIIEIKMRRLYWRKQKDGWKIITTDII